jgi:hypothetical protein
MKKSIVYIKLLKWPVRDVSSDKMVLMVVGLMTRETVS